MTIFNNHASAIQAALESNWGYAIKLNKKILKENGADLEALLRLAKAYEKNRDLNLAIKFYRKVIKIDRFNPIAKRNLFKLQNINKNIPPINKSNILIKADLFLEEPGKTKTVSLIRLAPAETLLLLENAEPVKLLTGRRTIAVKSEQNRYLGRIPDDLAQRLIRLINQGYQFLAVVKAVDKKTLQIFIKEVARNKKTASLPAFSVSTDQYHTFLPTSVISEDN